MATSQEKQILSDMLNSPSFDWERMDFKNIQSVEYEADALCQETTFIAAYLGARGANGCGDSGHKKAIQVAIKAKKKIRKALGYTYP